MSRAPFGSWHLGTAILAESQLVWRSIAANGLVILLGTYLTCTICLIGLAFSVRSLARRVSRLSEDIIQHRILLDKLNKSDDGHGQAIAGLTQRLQDLPSKSLPIRAIAPEERFTPETMAELRMEIEALLTELDDGEERETATLNAVDR